MSPRILNRRLLSLIRHIEISRPSNLSSVVSIWSRLQHNLATTTKFVPKSGAAHASEEDLCRLRDFIAKSRRLFVLTGAGVSTESGIRDYRSEGIGLYAISDQRPILHDDFLKKPLRRHRYWARNFAGWPIFSSKMPNKTHLSLAEMERKGKCHWLVTQNVDGLHTKAGSIKVTELHGTSSMYDIVRNHCTGLNQDTVFP